MSLARSFFYTGVRSIAYTLWSVADKSGAHIVTNFYIELVQGKGLEEALQSAKIKYLAEADPTKNHPFYWAGYVIVGNTEPIYLHERNSNLLLIITIFIVAGGAGILSFRKFKS